MPRMSRSPRYRCVSLLLPLLLCGLGGALLTAAPPEPKPAPGQALEPDHAAKMARGLAIFREHVRPVLAAQCVRCHGGEKTESELDLTDRAGLLRGGTRGPAIVPGKSAESRLYQVVRHAREPHMP